MKQHNTFIVFRDKETGDFLAEYKNNKSLAFTVNFSENIEDALIIPEEYFDKEKERYEGLLQAFGTELVKVEAEYTLTTLVKEESEVELEDKLHDELVRLNEAIERFIEAITGENE